MFEALVVLVLGLVLTLCFPVDMFAVLVASVLGQFVPADLSALP